MSQKTMDAKTVLASITENARQCTNELRMVRVFEVGQHARQGDIYLRYLGPKMTSELKKKLASRMGEETTNMQLAPGTNKGSRHILAPSGGTCTVYAPAKGRPEIEGPVFMTTERIVVTHPEHAHVSIPSGVYEVTFQVDHREEEAKQRRVQD